MSFYRIVEHYLIISQIGALVQAATYDMHCPQSKGVTESQAPASATGGGVIIIIIHSTTIAKCP